MSADANDRLLIERVGWLDALLADLDADGWALRYHDPTAAAECLRECRALADALRKTLAPAREEPGTPLTPEEWREIPF